DLVEAPFRLRALGRDVVEVFLPGAELLAGGVEAGLHGLHRLLRLGDGRMNRFDLLGEARGLGFEGGDLRVELLEMNERLQLTHRRSTPMVGPPGLEPGTDRV